MATDAIGTEATDPGTFTGGTILWLYMSWFAEGRVPTGDVGGGQAICTTFAASSCSAILVPVKMHKSTVLNTLDYSCCWRIGHLHHHSPFQPVFPAASLGNQRC